ncbi:MAG TPA: transglutaminase-like domain-containing protein, partial [Xanthomonadaceae bacterium]|nr:transglutaminase-like domain-containing protein [Xanthomonadaceae bacterium]
MGRFAAAEQAIATRLDAPATSGPTRDALAFERERMRRILLDFPHDAATVQARLRELIPDVRAQEIADWERVGLLEHLVIDGRKRYFDRAVSNLFRLSPSAAARRKNQTPFKDGPLERAHPHHREVRDAALASGSTHVLPRRVEVTQSLMVEADAVPDGELVRAWIPYPRDINDQQEDVRLIASLPAQRVIAPESALQRTVYLQQAARAGQPTRFSITYALTLSGQYQRIDPARVTALPATPQLAPYLAERAPHLVFTRALRTFSREVVGDETHPYRIAQKLFDAVDQRFPWAGAREYSTLRNISDYTLKARRGDCGQQTMLLIALLRLNGIPARWQSGMVFFDDASLASRYDNLHDWGQVYLAPYGWLPMDVTFGRLDDPDPQIAGFYLGGLDAYRIAFNDDYGRDFIPAKQHLRSETVDLQRGEAEWRGGNLYFDQWDYAFEARLLPA